MRFAAAHLGLFCLRMSHKKDARLTCIWVNMQIQIEVVDLVVLVGGCVCALGVGGGVRPFYIFHDFMS